MTYKALQGADAAWSKLRNSPVRITQLHAVFHEAMRATLAGVMRVTLLTHDERHAGCLDCNEPSICATAHSRKSQRLVYAWWGCSVMCRQTRGLHQNS